MSDTLVKAMSESGSLRIYACVVTDVVNEAYRRLQPATLAGLMLGRSLAGMALMAGTIKDRQRLSIRFEGNGPLGKIICDGDGEGNIRGTLGNPNCEFTPDEPPADQIKNALGRAGVLTVTKDFGLKKPYSGSVHLVSGEIGEDLAFYLTESEQIPSAVAVTALPNDDNSGVVVAGGYLIQAIPSHGGSGASDEANIESILQMMEALPSLATLLTEGVLPEDLIAKLFAEVPYKKIGVIPQRFHCSCNHMVMRQALKIAGNEEIEALIVEQHGAVLTCQFCNNEYRFTEGELKNIRDFG